MDLQTMPHAMYFSGSNEAVTRINNVPYQAIEYDDKGMFQAKLMDDTQVQIFIDIAKVSKNGKSHSYSYRRRCDRISFLD